MIRQVLWSRGNEDGIAVMDGNNRISYRALAGKAAAIQKQLRGSRRENVAILLPDGGDYISALFAVLGAGKTAFPLSVRLTRYELSAQLSQADVRTVITSEAFRPLFSERSGDAAAAPHVLYIEDFPASSSAALPLAAESETEEPMLLLGTSGTTGNAKIVQLSERNVESSVLAYLENMDYDRMPESEIRYMIAAPFSSSYGLLILFACIIKRFPIVLLRDAFTLDALYRAAQEHKVTHYEGGALVATLMDQSAGRKLSYDIRSLRYFGFAGSKVPVDTLHRLSEAFPGVEFWTGYGMTEASPLIAKPYKRMDPQKFASVGTAVSGVFIGVETDGVITDEPYRKGEIVVKGPNVMIGYYKNEEETRRIIKDGYLHTGDIGYLDEDGYLYICGRKKNVIIVRGFNVHAEEVEACILNSRLAEDCHVYGDIDEAGNETVCADIVPASPQVCEAQIWDYCRAHLSSYKQPRRIRMMDALPKTATGKNKKAGGDGVS